MSAGEQMVDDEDPNLARPPIVPPEELGPAAPSAVDPVMATLPPVPPPGAVPDPDAWPPPVPAEAPGMVPPPGAVQPAPPAPAAQPAPAAPGGPGGPAPAPTSPASVAQADADLGKAADEAHRAREESDKAQIDQMQGGADDVHAQREAADARADQARAAIDQQQAVKERYDAADTAAQHQIAQTQEALKTFKFRDYWANKSSAQRVGAALSVALGALGAGLTGTPNYALQILDKQMDDDHRLQVESLNGLQDEAVMARTGLQDSHAARQRALADITLGDAAKDRLIATQLDQAAARSKDANYQRTVAAFAAKLRDESAQKDLKAREFMRDAALREESARAKMNQEAAAAELSRTKAAAGGFAPRRGAGHGGAGGGGGRGDALAAFTSAALDGKTDEAHLASMGVRAGLKPNQVGAEVVRIRKEHAAGASGTAGLGNDRLLSKEAEAWANQNGIKQINQKQRELGAVLDEVHNAPHNPLQQALAIEKAVSSARGGAASKQALALALHHLGGKWDSIEAVIQGARDGEIGEKQMENFIGFMTNQLGTAQKEGKDKYDEFNKYVESQPAERRPTLLSERGRLFSGLSGFGGSAGGAAPAGKRVRLKDGRVGTLTADGLFHEGH